MRSPRSPCRTGSALLAPLVLCSCGMRALRAPLLVENTPDSTIRNLGNRFRLLSWNIHKETRPELVGDLRGLIDSGEPDLILLQEAAVAEDFSGIREALGARSWVLSANLADPSRHILYGILVASRARPIAARALLSKRTEPVLGTAKSALVVRYPIGTDTLTVVNLHALNFSPWHDGFRDQLSEIQASLGVEPGPCLVAGDFNTWSARKRSLADSIMLRSGLVAVDFGGRSSMRSSAFGNPLDLVYYTPGFLSVDSSGARVHDAVRTSDHAPLEVGFELLPDSSRSPSGIDPDLQTAIPSDVAP